MKKGIPAIMEMSELTAEIEKISPLKPIVVHGTFFSDKKGILVELIAEHNWSPQKIWNISNIKYNTTVYVYKTTTKEQIIKQFKKRMEHWTKPLRVRRKR